MPSTPSPHTGTPRGPAAVNRRHLGVVLIAAFMGWMFDGLEMGVFPLIARPALQEMQVAHGLAVSDGFVGLWMGYITAAFLIGAALGGLVFGWLGDRIGRVRAMTLSILCYSLFTGLIFLAREPWHLLVTRFVAALGMGGEWSLGVALVMEVWPERLRPLMAGIIGAAANVGFGLIALIGRWVTVTTDSWRWMALVGAGPALLAFVFRLFVPESARWQEAVRNAPAKVQPLRELFRPPLLKPLLLATLFASIALIGTWASVQWLPLWADQLTGGLRPAAKATTALVVAVGAIIGCLGGAWIGAWLGRRAAYFLLCLGSTISCAGLYRGIDGYGTAFLALAFLVGLLTAAFYGWLPLYLPELFPTRVRATGQGVAFNAGRILAAAGALFGGELVRQFGGSYARTGAVITLVYVLGLFVIWFAPETKGRPLPD